MEKQKNNKKRNILPPRDISFFCQQIADLLAAGISPAEGLDVMVEDAATPKEREVLVAMRDRLEDRVPLSTVLEECGLFPEYVHRMTRIGEETGRLDETMKGLSSYYEKEAETSRALRDAAAYPVVMVVILLAVLFFLSVEVMPVFAGVFAQLGAEFSPLTQGVVRWAGIISGAGLCLILLALVAMVVLRLVDRKTGKATACLRGLFLDNRPLFREIGVSRLASVLSMALKSGMDIDQGMEMAIALVDNKRVEAQAKQCLDLAAAGKSFPEATKAAGLFSAMHRQMIQVALRTGGLDDAMGRIAKDCEESSDDRISRSLARLEPLLTAALSIVAGGILILVMLPLIGVLSSLG